MSPRSFKRWRRRPGLSRPLFSCFDLALAQNEMLAQRFAQLGAAEAHGVGNLKADAPAPPVDKEAQKLIGSAIAGRPVWLAASTHQGEDEMVASAHIAMKRTKPNLLTIIVPRHPDRGPLIMKQLSALGLNVVLRSEGRLPDAATDIYIADTMGEMGLFYTLAPVAFVGGSLVRRGELTPLTLDAVRRIDPWTFGGDLLLGSVIVGAALGLIIGGTTWMLTRGSAGDEWFAELARHASDRFATVSITAWEFARGKLRGDPLYRTMLASGHLTSGRTLVDVGCGSGLTLALLAEAAVTARERRWPRDLPAPPIF